MAHERRWEDGDGYWIELADIDPEHKVEITYRGDKESVFAQLQTEESEVWLSPAQVAEIRDWCNAHLARVNFEEEGMGTEGRRT